MCSPYQRARPLVCWLTINKDVLPKFHCSLIFNQEAVIDAEMMGMEVYLEERASRGRWKKPQGTKFGFCG